LPIGELLADRRDRATNFTDECSLPGVRLAGVWQTHRAQQNDFVVRLHGQVGFFRQRIDD